MADLLDLAERCEKAAGPDREFDALIRETLDDRFKPEHRVMYYGKPTGEHIDVQDGDRFVSSPAYTASLDAAMTLAPEEWTAWELKSHGRKTRFSADLSRLTECDAGEDWAHGRGATPALALCAAALRARAALSESSTAQDPRGTAACTTPPPAQTS